MIQRTIQEAFIDTKECWDKSPLLKSVNIASDCLSSERLAYKSHPWLVSQELGF